MLKFPSLTKDYFPRVLLTRFDRSANENKRVSQNSWQSQRRLRPVSVEPRVEGLRLVLQAKPSSREPALRRGSQHGKGTKHIQDA